MDREVALLAEMDKVKAEAMEILGSRQRKAEALKRMTDVAVRMSEEQLVELRADIKHFVSERKYDEDLGRVARFSCDLDALKRSIAAFGQVSHPKNSYSTRSRCTSLTAAALGSPGDAAAPPAATTATSPSTGTKKPPAAAEGPGGDTSSRPPQPARERTRRPGTGPRPQPPPAAPPRPAPELRLQHQDPASPLLLCAIPGSFASFPTPPFALCSPLLPPSSGLSGFSFPTFIPCWQRG